MVFTIFGCLLVKKSKTKFLLSSIKSLTNCENPSSNPLGKLVRAYPYPPVFRKPAMTLYTGENQPI
jgi:hypothetical protein